MLPRFDDLIIARTFEEYLPTAVRCLVPLPLFPVSSTQN